jgi:hypothetical protein
MAKSRLFENDSNCLGRELHPHEQPMGVCMQSV